MSTQLIDSQGRNFPYLRLSLTDVCNYSCSYCLPEGYQCHSKPSYLSLHEIANLVGAFAELGTWKVRLTGGEPSVRKDFKDILKTVSCIPGIQQVAVTTNGYKLRERIHDWVDAGLTHLNVSVDSLDPRLFHTLTGHNRLTEILEGVDRALQLPLKKVKLNAVLLKNINSHMFSEYTQLLKTKKLSMRFIELMQTGDNLKYFNQYHVSSNSLKEYLNVNGWTPKMKEEGAGPAIEYINPNYKGTFGVIAPYSKGFCDSCNRLRMSSTGNLHLCLFGEQGFSLRHLMQSESQREELKDTICNLLQKKKKQHFLHEGNSGGTPHLAAVGG